jgi:alpha-galactosidase
MKSIGWSLLLVHAVATNADASRIDGNGSNTNLRGRAIELNHTRDDVNSCGGDAPVQVFVLAGQSNMEGFGSIEHLEMLMDNETTRDAYEHLWDDEQGKWTTVEDVHVSFRDLHGLLTVGGFGAYPEWFGPELGFGWKIKEHLSACNRPMLLLKVAFGGRDLAIDFRPPSAGIGDYEKDGAGNIYNATTGPFNETTYGHEYRNMIHIITDTLENRLPQVLEGYNAPSEGSKYSLEGFVWFQGFNDVVDEKKSNEYQSNLAKLIRDVRKDLNATALPFVIGELGTFGSEEYGFELPSWPYVRVIQDAQRNVTNSEEFTNTTRYVPTGRYLVDDQERWQQLHHYCKSFGRFK